MYCPKNTKSKQTHVGLVVEMFTNVSHDNNDLKTRTVNHYRLHNLPYRWTQFWELGGNTRENCWKQDTQLHEALFTNEMALTYKSFSARWQSREDLSDSRLEEHGLNTRNSHENNVYSGKQQRKHTRNWQPCTVTAASNELTKLNSVNWRLAAARSMF